MIKIVTLGDFDILVNDMSILENISAQKRIMKLFKYFLLHEDEKLLPQNIIEDLWGDEDFKNPLGMLRTQISRLRCILDDKPSMEPFFEIKYINGYYLFKLDEGCIVDFREFENLLEQNFQNIKDYINENPIKFKELILSYKGRFLAEIGNEDWLIPIRNRFARLYVKGISYYLDYLKENSLHTETINVCETAIKIKPYEEIIHYTFMETLVSLKQQSYALIHYEFYTRKLYTDLGVVPSKKLRELYKKIKQKEENPSARIDLNHLDSEMTKEFNFGGVIFCDKEIFKFLYNYELRNKERRSDTDLGVGLGVVTLESESHRVLNKKELKKGMDSLGYVFFKTFRYGDIVSNWNDSQMLIMLYGLKEEHIQTVVNKINNNFNSEKLDERLKLNIKLNIL
nr:BTAD domain-containing putative transcriptional regulator [Tissierella sp.]